MRGVGAPSVLGFLCGPCSLQPLLCEILMVALREVIPPAFWG